MKRSLLLWLLLIAAFAGCRRDPAGTPDIEVYFSPRGGCTDAVVGQIDAARSSILVQAYSFTSAPIAKALVDAHKRGVKVEVILDSSQKSEKYSSADFLVHAGIPTRIDEKHAIAHNKIMVIDDQTVITGSFNFTKAAENSNAENLLVIRDPSLAARYAANWHAHARHSELYGGKATADAAEPSAEEDARSNRASSQRAGADPPEHGRPAVIGYVASANSSVFHRPDCRSVAKISGKNREVYASRDEAIRAGKKPCAECKP